MNGEALTIIGTAAGIVFGGVISWWFARAGRQASAVERSDLLSEISTLRKMLSEVVDSITEPFVAQPAIERGLGNALREGTIRNVAVAASAPPPPAPSPSAVAVIVRAALGALVDEKGQVSVSRLFHEAEHVAGPSSVGAVREVLKQLRHTGSVSWDGEDLSGVSYITVHPPHMTENTSGEESIRS